MPVIWRWSALVAVEGPAAAQTPPQPPLTDPSLGITVTATQLDEGRSSIQPSLGATVYDFSKRTIENIPQGENAPLNQVLLRAPGVVQDSFGQIHVRGDHGNVQYRLDGVQLPAGLSLFNNMPGHAYADQMSLLTGALPAQYGLQTAGIVDMTLKSGTTDPGAEVSVTGGSRDYAQPAFSYGGRTGAIDYFAAGQYIHNGLGIENPTSIVCRFTTTPTNGTGWPRSPASSTRTRGSPSSPAARSRASRFPNSRSRRRTSPCYGQLGNWNSAGRSTSASGRTTTSPSLSLQKHYQDGDFQLSGFTRYSSLSYQPDPYGDLMFNGIAPWSNRTERRHRRAGRRLLEGGDKHTLRARLPGAARARHQPTTDAQVAAADPRRRTGTPTSRPAGRHPERLRPDRLALRRLPAGRMEAHARPSR